jgi:pimeloyl-ACP methyl ester carboxylesterase
MSTVAGTLHDGSEVAVTVEGEGPNLLLPVDPTPAQGAEAEMLRAWGTDPALGRTLIDAFSDAYRVIAVDYLGHRLAVPAAESLTPDNLVGDLLAVADAADAAQFAYCGYSWLGPAGLQLALRTDRLTALAMGGFPPLGGPYAEMLAVTLATHVLAAENPAPTAPPAPQAAGEDYDWSTAEVGLSRTQTRQFVTLYEALRDFDDRTAIDRVTVPRLAFAGTRDTIEYAEKWGGVRVSMAEALIQHRAELESRGWRVELLDGLDHTGAMQPSAVLPVVRPWLDAVR